MIISATWYVLYCSNVDTRGHLFIKSLLVKFPTITGNIFQKTFTDKVWSRSDMWYVMDKLLWYTVQQKGKIISNFKQIGPLSLDNIKKDKLIGLWSVLYVQCLKFYHLNEVCTSSQHRFGMVQDVRIAEFVQWPRQKENKLQSMTAEKITQGLQSLWKVPLPVNRGTKHHYRTQDTPYTLGMMTQQLYVTCKRKCHMVLKNGLTSHMLKDHWPLDRIT